MKSTWVQIVFSIYLALVCLISGIALSVTVVSLTQNAVEYKMPELGLAEDIYAVKWQEGVKHQLSDTETQEEKQKAVERKKLRALTDLVDGGITLFFLSLIFLFHWRMFKKTYEREVS